MRKQARFVLTLISLGFTIFLVGFGFQKGYETIELVVYNMYFLSEIILKIDSMV